MDELCSLIDIRLRERHDQKKVEHQEKSGDKPFKLYPSELGLCHRAIKFRQLDMEAKPFSLDTLNRFDKGAEVEVYVKKFLKPEEILFEELPIETEYFSGRADIGVKLNGQNILYELKSKDRGYLRFIKTTEQQYESLKQNLFQAYFYFQELEAKYNLSKAVVLCISEDRSWKLPFACPDSGQFVEDYIHEENTLIETMLGNRTPDAIWTWQCYNKKYGRINCPYIKYCCVELNVEIKDGKVVEK